MLGRVTMRQFRLLGKFNFWVMALWFFLLAPTLAQSAVTSVNGTITTDFTFAQGETYLVSGPVTMTGVTTIEGGTTIKYDSSGSLDISDPVFNTTSSNPAIFTSKDDDSVGEVIAGSTGSPVSYPNALTLAKGSVRYVQIRYANDGIVFPGNETLNVRDSEFLAVGTPVDASSNAGPATVNLNNLLIVQGTNGPVLADDGTNALTVNASNITMAHLTGDGFGNLTTAAGSSLNVTDSLFVDIQGTSVFANTAPTAENYNAFFQTPQNGSGANDVVLTANPILTDWFLDQASPVIDAGSQSASSVGLYHYNTNTDGTLEGPTTVDIGYHFPPSISQFSVLATNSIWLKSNSMVSGDIGVNEATAGPFLNSNVALAVGHDMVIPAAINLRADSIKVKTGAVVNGNVYHNQLENNGTINGTTLTPLAFPILDALPLFRSATLGTVSDINVTAGTVHVLAPGDYGIITVNDNATLQFTGGLYQIQKIDAKKTTSLLFDAPSEVRIKENLVTQRFSNLGPSAGATLNAGDIQFFVEGADVGTTLAVEFGHTHTVTGHFYAPNGTLSLKRQSTFSGIFLAKDVMIGHDSVVVLDPGTGQPIVAAPVIQPNGSIFAGSVDVSLSTITSGATIHYTTDGTTPTTASPVFTAPFTLTESATVKAIAVRADYVDSSIAMAQFTATVEPVAISPAGGSFFDSVDISLSTPTTGTTIHYTIDGTDPTTASTVFTAPFTLTTNVSPQTVKAFAVRTDWAGSTITSETFTVTPRPTTEVVTFNPPAGTFQDSVDVSLSSATPGATIHFTTDGTDPTSASTVFSTPINLTASATLKAFATFPSFNDSAITSAAYIIDTTPPVPGAIPEAPPLDETLIYNVASSTAFLYTGPNAVQTGMDPATIEPVRAAVVRGQVFQLDPADINNPPLPLEGVTVTILAHDDPTDPEFYGQTLSRADGFYDMAVNGGGQLTVQYSKTGFMPSQRKVQVPWQDFAITDDVVLIPLDPKVTPVDLASIPTGEVLEAQGTTQTDSDGTRTATLIFSSGTTAEMVMPDGTKTPITSLSMRATEYTVGENGPMAMPAVLPPTTAYTYMADFTADEALAVGATSIEFNQPVYGYVDNFLNVKPGEIVPNGFYDRVKGQWIPEGNGVVMDVINIDTSGATPIAELDLTGDGVADDHTLAPFDVLNITTGELVKLAQLYPGATPTTPASLWRVPMMHFSNFHYAMFASRAAEAADFNWARFLLDDALQILGIKEAPEPMNVEKCDTCGGSIIQVQAQIFGETVPVTGTPFSMHYNSDRVRGYKNTAKLDIPLIDPNLDFNNTSLKEIILRLDIAGRRFVFRYDLDPNNGIPDVVPGLTHSFVWDGLDAYGREASGAFNAKIAIGYEYPMFYSRPQCGPPPSGPTLNFGGSPQFACRGQVVLPARNSGPGLNPLSGRQSIVIQQDYSTTVSVKDYRSVGLGGWTLDANHVYDPFGPTLHLGTGPRRGTQTLPEVVTTIIGQQAFGPTPWPLAMKVNEKGEIIYASFAFSNSTIFKIGTDNSITTLTAGLPLISDIALAPDGTIYIAEGGAHRVIKRNPNGSTAVVAGQFGVSGSSGDGGPANQALLNSAASVAVDQEGNVYIADTNNNRIRMVDTNGIIHTVAGTGQLGAFIPFEQRGFGGPATQFHLSTPTHIEVDDQGNLYIGNFGGISTRTIIKVGTNGIATHFAGDQTGDFITDGIPATEARLESLSSMTVAKDGSMYLANRFNFQGVNYTAIRVVDPIGRIRTNYLQPVCGDVKENAPLDSNCLSVDRMDFHPNGDLIVDVRPWHRFFRISPALPGFSIQEQVLPSEDGSLLYVFDNTGRHTETRNALTDAVIFAFSYDATGQLESVTDGDGDVTTIQRDIDGNPISITSQDGQVTTLTLDANGYLATVANPNNETFQMVYDTGGLMTSFTRPKALTDPDPNANYTTSVTYDALGLLDRDTGADNGFLDIDRTEDADGYTITATTAEGRASSFHVEEDASGNTIRTNTDPNGLVTVTTELSNGNVLTTSREGTQTTVTKLPDPRFGMLAPLSSIKVQTPSGLTFNRTPTRTVNLDSSGNLVSRTDALNINGRVFTSVLNKVDPNTNPESFRIITTSPVGRQFTFFIDEQRRIVQQRIPNIYNVSYTYDTRGRLKTITKGDGTPSIDRTGTIVYNGNGFIDSVIDPIGRTSSFQYDPIGRITKQILPDLREIIYTYDANGNVASITPPGRPNHTFDYTNIDLENEYTPPNVTPPLADTRTFFSYNLDKQITSVTRPDGQVIALGYEPGGRLSTITIPQGAGTVNYTHTYNPVTGKLETISAPDGGSLNYTYDGSLFISSTWNGLFTSPMSVSHTYDDGRTSNNDFWVTSRSINGANTISFEYDNDGLMTVAGDETLAYDPANGFLTDTTLGLVTDSYQYNLFGDTNNYTAQVNGVNQFVSNFTQDKLGRITQKTETVQGVTHTFDYIYNDAGYLVEVKRDGVITATYTYDLNGNRLNSGAVYDTQDRLTSNNTASYTYTDNGELLTKTEGIDITQYNYDVLGNLLSVTLPSGTLIEYVIDGQGRRIGKRVDGILQQAWLYKDDLNPIAELDGTGNVVSRFVYASEANIPDYVIKGGTTYRIISDHVGSPRLVIDVATGAIIQSIEYDEWGNVLSDTNPGFLPFNFAGGLYDADTNLIRFGARDYDPEIGRWTIKDPVRFDGDGTNLYSYVLNDPINFFDPFGLDRYVIIVGDPGLGRHNQGDNFQRAANTRAEELRDNGHTVDVKRASSISDVNDAITSGEKITGGVVLFGHGSEGMFSPGEQSGEETNIDEDNVDQLSNSNLGPNATIEVNGCNTGVGDEDEDIEPIAQTIADQLNRTVTGSTRTMGFSNDGNFNNYKPLDRNKPVYMIPDPGGVMKTFKPNP